MATPISDEDADQYFQERRRDAQLTSLVSEQSSVLENSESLTVKLHEAEKKFASEQILRPETWGGYCVKPERIEFLAFEKNRLHERTLFVFGGGSWKQTFLQP